jgi:hypothetical protein
MDRNDEVKAEGMKRASAKARKMKAKGRDVWCDCYYVPLDTIKRR